MPAGEGGGATGSLLESGKKVDLPDCVDGEAGEKLLVEAGAVVEVVTLSSLSKKLRQLVPLLNIFRAGSVLELRSCSDVDLPVILDSSPVAALVTNFITINDASVGTLP